MYEKPLCVDSEIIELYRLSYIASTNVSGYENTTRKKCDWTLSISDRSQMGAATHRPRPIKESKTIM